MCYRLITLLLFCVLVFAGCRSEDPAPEPSPAALARSVQAEEDSALYLGLIRRLDFLLEGEDWPSPEEIDKVYLTQWYLRRWILSHGDGGEFLVTPLLSANEDGLFFPEGELEAAVEEAFGLSSEWLREDNLTYRPEEAGYRTAGAAGDLRRYEIDLLTAQEEGGVLTLTFTLESDAGLPRQTKEMTVLTDGDAPRYRSLVTLP